MKIMPTSEIGTTCWVTSDQKTTWLLNEDIRFDV